MLSLLRRPLHIELQTHGCTIRRPLRWGLTARDEAFEDVASGSGRGAQALDAALANLRQTSELRHPVGAPLPLAARLTVADEYVRYDIVLGRDLRRSDQEHALARATHRFADRLGHDDCIVAVTPMPGSDDWLSAALDREEVSVWTQVLESHGVRLQYLHPALVEDLRRIAGQIHDADALVVLPREEGALFLRLHAGAPRQLHWQALDPQETAIFEWRLREFATRTAPPALAAPLRHDVVYLLSRSQALCRYVLDPPSARRAA